MRKRREVDPADRLHRPLSGRVNAFGDAGPEVRLRRARLDRPGQRDHALQLVEHVAAVRALPKMRFHVPALLRRQLAVEIVRQPVGPFFVHAHDPPRCFRINIRAR